MRELDPGAYLSALRAGARVIDCRPAAARRRDPLPGSVALSLAEIERGGRPPFDPNQAAVAVCEYGRISRLIALYLAADGYAEVDSLAGGLVALRRHRRAVGGD